MPNKFYPRRRHALLAAVNWSHLVYVDVIEASSWLRYSANVGAHRPLYSTSLGLTMLAFATPERQRHYLNTARLEAVTAHTITTPKGLIDTFRQIQAEGCACSAGSVEGATGVAAPIFDGDGAIYAAVGIGGPTSRFERNAERFIDLVRQCGTQMSRALGYEGRYPGKD